VKHTAAKKNPALSTLQTKVVREIVALVRRAQWPRGHHLTEQQLAEQIGTSRSPVQVALRYLAEKGLLTQSVHRGYTLAIAAKKWDDIANSLERQPDDPLYLQIAEDRRLGRLHDEVSENELMRRYEVARGSLRKVLARMSLEGMVEQKVGHGWCFSPMIDTGEAYAESYLFRQAVEPIGLLSPMFRCNCEELAARQKEQEYIVAGGYKTMTAIELFEANSRFHETLAHWSGNRFILQSIKRINQQRRLLEYQQAQKRKPRQHQAQEHLAILQAIAAQDLVQAANLMRNHLEGARRAKLAQSTN
jgi:DNA-binding GntR family transcriptional regulator